MFRSVADGPRRDLQPRRLPRRPLCVLSHSILFLHQQRVFQSIRRPFRSSDTSTSNNQRSSGRSDATNGNGDDIGGFDDVCVVDGEVRARLMPAHVATPRTTAPLTTTTHRTAPYCTVLHGVSYLPHYTSRS